MTSLQKILPTLLLLAAAGLARSASAAYPDSPRRPVQDTYHGTTVSEDHRWLEHTDSKEVRAWIAAQNRRTRQAIDALPQRKAIKQELMRMEGSGGRASRRGFDHVGGKLFALKHQPPKNQDMLVVLDPGGDVASERVLLDPNKLDRRGTTTIDWFKASHDGSVVAEIFGLTAEEKKWLMVVPYKGSLPTAVPTDPLIYRFYELVSVYGTTFKELIHEEFGDGIMSAIDFRMDLQREPDPKGDRVQIVMSGKFLPYKTY